ncbi:hypothetical protein PISL3812_06938 [Talaromyces islandicus]|uniref:Uncharacterized protein n=1 Tax=Talaromyces islandicus TaxID=28573 RepID=A0A0U1M2V4_TALIS|nr:hypothetical protein PISL3812_06938 [Talaromyces islandicus]
MDHSTPPRNSERPTDSSSSRLSSAKTFPVHLHHRHRSESRPSTPGERQHWSRRLFIDTSDLEPDKARAVENNHNGYHGHHNGGKHRHSKSRDHRIPRAVNQIASAGGARNLLPSRTFHRGDKEKEAGDDNLLKPAATLDSSRSVQSSRSTSTHNAESRQGSLAATGGSGDLSKKLALANLRDVKTMEDLDEVKRRREKGEESLRTKLSSVGSLAADITRRLDYTYYNLLERVSTLYSTIRAFQDLVDSSSTLQDDFERDNANLEQDFRRQLGEFKQFCPQIDRIDVLEKRMSAGRNKMEALGKRLDSVRQEIEGWERRENEWQARVSRRLRIFWAIIITATVLVVIAYVVQEWPVKFSLSDDLLPSHQPEISHVVTGGIHPVLPEDSNAEVESPFITRSSTRTATSASESQTTRTQYESSDPLRLFDEL